MASKAARPRMAARRFARIAKLLPTFAMATLPSTADAQTAIDHRWETSSYVLHGTIAAALVGGSFAFKDLVRAPQGTRWCRMGRFDSSVEGYFNQEAATMSDTLLITSVAALPAASQWGLGLDRGLTNSTFVYAEAQGVNVSLNTAAKYIFHRLRPYAQARHTNDEAQKFYERAKDDPDVSFYSGHASSAFTAATTSSILFSLRANDGSEEAKWQRRVMWASQFGVAGLVSDLRVLAGRHYRTDVIVGMMMGVGIGVGIPAAHDLDLRQVTANEVAWGASAAVFGFGGAELFRALFPSTFDARGQADQSRATWTLLPTQIESAPGAMLTGEF